MKDIRIDSAGELRCWNCGNSHFTEKRTFRAKAIGMTAGVATLGIAGAAAPLVTRKKLKCQACGKYNQVGNAKPYEPPQSPTDDTPTRPNLREQAVQDRIARRTYTPPKHIPPNPGSSRAGEFLDVKPKKRTY